MAVNCAYCNDKGCPHCDAGYVTRLSRKTRFEAATQFLEENIVTYPRPGVQVMTCPQTPDELIQLIMKCQKETLRRCYKTPTDPLGLNIGELPDTLPLSLDAPNPISQRMDRLDLRPRSEPLPVPAKEPIAWRKRETR